MKRRSYNKVLRAAAEEETRGRIVEALMALHEEVGPSRTTVSAVAAHAGVERLTVYRHFPDERAMIEACSSRWMELHPPPSIPTKDPRRALTALYAWYRRNERMLTQINADVDRVPTLRDVYLDQTDAYLDHFAAALDRAFGSRNARRRATLRHAVELATWRSLQRLTGSDTRAATMVMSWIGES